MIIGYTLLVIALIEFILGLLFIFKYQKSQTTIWYGLFCIGVSVYVASNGSGYIFGASGGGFNEHAGWAGGIIATIMFLPFSYSFPITRKKISELLSLVMWPFVIFLPASLFTDLLISNKGIYKFGESYETSVGIYFWVMILFFGVYWFWSFINLIASHQTSDGIHRWQLKYLILGTLLSFAVTVSFDIIIPLVTSSRFGYVGSLFTSVWLGFTSYILLKK